MSQVVLVAWFRLYEIGNNKVKHVRYIPVIHRRQLNVIFISQLSLCLSFVSMQSAKV